MSPTDLFDLVDLDWSNADGEPDSGSWLDHLYDINPGEFLDFAKRDLECSDRRSLVNALSNCKRAIDCQVHKVLKCLGVPAKGKNIPEKLSILADLGVVAPRILQKINRTRNYLEHEFKCPKREKVEDAVDITELFLSASNASLAPFEDSFSIGVRGEHISEEGRCHHCVYVQFETEEKQFNLRGYNRGTAVGEAVVNSTDPCYRHLLRIALAFPKGQDKVVQAIGQLGVLICTSGNLART